MAIDVYQTNALSRTIEELRKRQKIAIFGDNFRYKGSLGQANIRSHPDSFGIPTKHAPSTFDSSYLSDAEYDWYVDRLAEVKLKLLMEIERKIELASRFDEKFALIIPEAQLGSGLAKLQTKAPKCYDYVNTWLLEILDLYECVFHYRNY